MSGYRSPSRGLEWMMVRAFTEGDTPDETIKMLREEGEPWRHILLSIDKCSRMRSSPTHVMGYQAWRWWVDRMRIRATMMQANEQKTHGAPTQTH